MYSSGIPKLPIELLLWDPRSALSEHLAPNSQHECARKLILSTRSTLTTQPLQSPWRELTTTS